MNTKYSVLVSYIFLFEQTSCRFCRFSDLKKKLIFLFYFKRYRKTKNTLSLIVLRLYQLAVLNLLYNVSFLKDLIFFKMHRQEIKNSFISILRQILPLMIFLFLIMTVKMSFSCWGFVLGALFMYTFRQNFRPLTLLEVEKSL